MCIIQHTGDPTCKSSSKVCRFCSRFFKLPFLSLASATLFWFELDAVKAHEACCQPHDSWAASAGKFSTKSHNHINFDVLQVKVH